MGTALAEYYLLLAMICSWSVAKPWPVAKLGSVAKPWPVAKPGLVAKPWSVARSALA